MTTSNSWLAGALVMVLLLGGCSPKLHVEAYRGNLLSVKEILDNGEKIAKTDYRGWTALHYAAEGGHETIVDLLLDKGAENVHGYGFHTCFLYGSVEKSRQRRSRHFSVLTYYAYAPRVTMAAALPRGGVLHAGLGGLPMLDSFEPTRSL